MKKANLLCIKCIVIIAVGSCGIMLHNKSIPQITTYSEIVLSNIDAFMATEEKDDTNVKMAEKKETSVTSEKIEESYFDFVEGKWVNKIVGYIIITTTRCIGDGVVKCYPGVDYDYKEVEDTEQS